MRPKAKQWIDKPFYLEIKLGKCAMDEEKVTTQVKIGECTFKVGTSVVRNRYELENYMETLVKIID